ncbi:MAG: hypothetical protein V3V41_08035 [Candidatus Heimdallarchaeota archaeon]
MTYKEIAIKILTDKKDEDPFHKEVVRLDLDGSGVLSQEELKQLCEKTSNGVEYVNTMQDTMNNQMGQVELNRERLETQKENHALKMQREREKLNSDIKTFELSKIKFGWKAGSIISAIFIAGGLTKTFLDWIL